MHTVILLMIPFNNLTTPHLIMLTAPALSLTLVKPHFPNLGKQIQKEQIQSWPLRMKESPNTALVTADKLLIQHA